MLYSVNIAVCARQINGIVSEVRKPTKNEFRKQVQSIEEHFCFVCITHWLLSCTYFQTYVCSLTLQEFCVVDSTVHLVHFVCDGVSCCMTHGTSSHFPLYSFHVTDSIYYVWEDVCYFEIPVYVLVMCQVSSPVSFFLWHNIPQWVRASM